MASGSCGWSPDPPDTRCSAIVLLRGGRSGASRAWPACPACCTPSCAARRSARSRLLSSPTRPTAVLYDNDVMAVAGMSVAYEMGVDVPLDLSIVAWDDSVLCEIVHPQLTRGTAEGCAGESGPGGSPRLGLPPERNSRAAARDELRRRVLEGRDRLAVDELEQPLRGVRAVLGDVAAERGEGRVHELAQRRVVPRHERDVAGHGEAHLLGHRHAGDGHDVVVVQDRRR